MNSEIMNPETNDEPKVNINEHDVVRLRFALHLEGLPAGTQGTVVHVHPAREAFEVKFAGGKILTLEPVQVQLAQEPVPELAKEAIHAVTPEPIPGPVQPVPFVPAPVTGVEFVPAPPMPPAKIKKPKKRRETKGDRLQNAAQAVLDAVEEARSKADGLQAAIDEAKDELQTTLDDLQSALDDLKQIREDEYQNWWDNMPEGLQQGPTGEKLSTLLEIDLEQDMPELPEIEEIDFSNIEGAAQEILDADLPMGFGRD